MLMIRFLILFIAHWKYGKALYSWTWILVKGQLVNLVSIDLVLDYMILGYLGAKRFLRIYLYLNGLRSYWVKLSMDKGGG
jgi:hypothetical protein